MKIVKYNLPPVCVLVHTRDDSLVINSVICRPYLYFISAPRGKVAAENVLYKLVCNAVSIGFTVK